MSRTAQFISDALRPPSRLPLAQWAEANVRLDHTSYVQGRLSLEFYPQLRAFFRHADNRRMKRLTVMKAAQTAATTGMMVALLNRIAENPVAAMWVTANAEKAKEYVNRRLFPALLDCPAVAALAPADWTWRLVQFATMDLMIRGAVSKQEMTSDPVGLMICDERREWQIPVELVRQRMKTFGNAQEISIGTAGIVNDSLHSDWRDGSQGFIHFTCPKCAHSQPFRFGKKKTALFPEAREIGGVVWPDDERTRNADGSWKLEATVNPDGTRLGDGVRCLAEYQCEKCGDKLPQSARLPLLRTATDVHRNAKMVEQFPSLHWNFMVMPGDAMDFGAGAVTFLTAMAALKASGNQEPLRYFVTDDCGEPWEMLASKIEASDIMARMGNYCVGEKFKAEAGESFTLMTVDRQKGHLIYVIRQWLKGGASRLIEFGKLPDDFEALRKFQMERGIRSVSGDDGGYDEADTGNVFKWRMACVKYGWNSFKGDKAENFSDEKVRTYWRRSPFNTGVGAHVLHNAYLWSKGHYLAKLYNVFLKGEGPTWTIPRDVQAEYLHQLQAYEFRPAENPGEKGEWTKSGADHAASCELMQIVFADSSGIISSFGQAA